MKDDVALAGSLDFLNLGDLLQLFGSNGSTGILRIYSDYSTESGAIYIQKGNPTNAFCGSEIGLDALYALFGWIKGRFEFTDQEISDEKVINKGRMEILLDGLRMLDDGEIKKLGPADGDEKSGELPASKDGVPLIKGPLVDYMYVVDEEEYQDGQEIVTEQRHGNWIWVIVQGVVGVYKEIPDGRIKIARITDGGYIGSMATFTVNGNVRSATTIAEGNVTLAVLDTQRLFGEFSGLSTEFKKFLLSLDKRLREVTAQTVNVLLNRLKLEDWVTGRKPVVSQGKTENRLFRITGGEATVVRHTEQGHVPLARLGKGDFFGKVPFFDLGQEPHSASVYGSEDLETEAMDLETLQAEYDRVSGTFKKLIEHLSTCISVTSRVARDFNKKNATNNTGSK